MTSKTTNQSFVDDALHLGGALLAQVLEARHEIKAQAKARFGDVAGSLNMVSREEFDVAMTMLAKARMEQEAMAERLASLESLMGVKAVKPTKATKTSRAASPKTAKANLPSVKKSARRS